QNPTLAPFLNTIEQARRNGTLRSLDLGAVYPASVAIGRAQGGAVRSDGGSSDAPGSFSTPSASGSVTLSTATLEQLLGQVLEKMDKPVPAVVSMLGRGGIIEAQDSYNRMVKAGRINK
ncbi:MAG: hypothetical protein IJU13_04175, partial [Bacteroidales bacterium]|nr:hypothetical protein [Bacteroidales bacterium]